MSTTSGIISPTTTKEILLAAPLPKKTKSYSPVPHKVIIEKTLEQLGKAGIKVISEKYTSAREGRQANGIYQLQGGDLEMNFRLQWQNSYDKSLPMAVGFGSHVIVCGNGLIIGDMGRFKRKHTGTILTEFEESIIQYIGDAADNFERMVKDRERMKEIEMTKRTTAELVGRMFLEEQIITANQLGIIKREMEVPSYDYGIKDTLWNTYNAVTVSLKEAHPQFSMEQHINLHDFVTKEFVKEFA